MRPLHGTRGWRCGVVLAQRGAQPRAAPRSPHAPVLLLHLDAVHLHDQQRRQHTHLAQVRRGRRGVRVRPLHDCGPTPHGAARASPGPRPWVCVGGAHMCCMVGCGHRRAGPGAMLAKARADALLRRRTRPRWGRPAGFSLGTGVRRGRAEPCAHQAEPGLRFPLWPAHALWNPRTRCLGAQEDAARASVHVHAAPCACAAPVHQRLLHPCPRLSLLG
jgi:hypothetical protein